MESYTKNELFVDQRYQRKLVWSLEDKILFIDSLMKAFPIPNIMMAEYNGKEGNTTYGIIDGLQRINAIISFMLGEFPISINGKTGYFNINCATGTFDLFQEGKLRQRDPVLDRQICTEFRGYKLPIISTSHDEAIIDEIFKRLNSTGTKLSKHDLRQAGALNKFSQLVREISSTIRGGKTLHDIVTLEIMPQISLSNKGLNYGINIENVFWRRHGILTEDLLRKSRDEEIIATLLGAFLLERPISVISSSILDNLYDEKTEDGKIADEKLKECFDNLKTLFIQVFNEIDLICDEAKTNISDMLFIGDRRKTDMFMVFFETMLQVYFESKAIGDYNDFVDTVKNAKQSILSKLEEKNSVDYLTEKNTIRLFKDLIASHLVATETESAMAREVISRLNLSSTETRYTEYKIGFTFFNTPSKYRHNEGKINYSNISQMAKVASAMANIRRDPDSLGMIIVGVADNEKDYSDWSSHYKRNAYKYNSHRVVGIDAEAEVHYKSVDCMMNAFKARVDMEPISNELKEDLKSYELVTIQKRILIVITITARSGQLYGGKNISEKVQILKKYR